MRTFSSRAVTDFIWEDVICCHSYFGKLIIDRELENKDAIVELTRRYRVKRVVVSANHLQANRMIERGYKLIVNTVSKMSD